METRRNCQACRDGVSFDIPITMAFQPILDFGSHQIFAQEALLRGADGAGAGAILSKVSDENRYAFDQKCRVTALELASSLNLVDEAGLLSINFLPNAVYEPRACIRLTLETARKTGLPANRIMFEFTEVERLDPVHLLNILRTYNTLGFLTAIDDFGSGYAGLELLSNFQPDVVKLDMALIRNIDTTPAKRIIVRDTIHMLSDLGIRPVCEGIETRAEYECLRELGVDLMQGYLFARPALEAFAKPNWLETTDLDVAQAT